MRITLVAFAMYKGSLGEKLKTFLAFAIGSLGDLEKIFKKAQLLQDSKTPNSESNERASTEDRFCD